MSGAYDDQDDADLDSFEADGLQAFNAMTVAMQGLGTRLGTFEQGFGAKVTAAERAATSAETAAQNAKETAKHAEATARAGARSVASWAVLGALAGVLVAGGVGYWLGHSSGREGGLADGYKAAMDEKAAAAWANTPSGKLALAMDQLGSLAMLARCGVQGWHTETQQGRRFCFGSPAPDGHTYGWPLP